MLVKLHILLFVVCIVSCSSSQNRICQINGDVQYLKTSELCRIHTPNDVVDFYVMGKYCIPEINNYTDSKFGKDLNICPPKVVG